MDIQEALEAYIENYFDRLEQLGFEGVMEDQDGRFASLAFGAAGIAYAYWHAALRTGREEWREGARRWVRWAHEHSATSVAFFPRKGEPRPPEDWRDLATGAFLYGRVGIDFVRALVAHSTADDADLQQALREFTAGCRHEPCVPVGSTELYTGLAGNLQATALLWRAIGHPALWELGQELTERLSRRTGLHDDAGCSIQWGEPRGRGLAHGVAGVLFALMSWARASGEPLPPGARPTLDRLLDGALREPRRSFCSRPKFVASLCNGFAGLGLVAVAAHQLLEDERYLADARWAARLALEAVPPRPDLCCGRAGVASIYLALAAVEPEPPQQLQWRQRALELTVSAMLAEPDTWEVVGLYGGEAAVPCLALDLLARGPGGPPALVCPTAMPSEAPEAQRTAVARSSVARSSVAPGRPATQHSRAEASI